MWQRAVLAQRAQLANAYPDSIVRAIGIPVVRASTLPPYGPAAPVPPLLEPPDRPVVVTFEKRELARFCVRSTRASAPGETDCPRKSPRRCFANGASLHGGASSPRRERRRCLRAARAFFVRPDDRSGHHQLRRGEEVRPPHNPRTSLRAELHLLPAVTRKEQGQYRELGID